MKGKRNIVSKVHAKIFPVEQQCVTIQARHWKLAEEIVDLVIKEWKNVNSDD